MTSKERLLCAIERKTPDRLPATTHHIMQYYLDKYLDGKNTNEFFQHFGLDSIAWVGSCEYTQAQKEDWNITSEKIENQKYPTERYTIKTPKGDLTAEIQYGSYSVWLTERFLKEKKDIDILAKHMPHFHCNKDVINDIYDKNPNDLIRTNIPSFDVFGQPGCWQDAACLFGIENLIMECYDDPQWVHELLAILQQRKLAYINTLSGVKLDIIELGGGDASTTVISPSIFEEFVAPYDSKLIDAAHKNGQRIVYHTCGGMMPILEDIAAMNPDAMETFTPIGMGGDCDLKEAKRRIGSKVCMIGGFDQFHYFAGCTPEETRKEVRRCFEEAGEGGGFILSPSDHFFDADNELIMAFADESMKCVY